MHSGGYGFTLGGTLAALLYLIIKLLIVVLAVVVVLGVIVWVRDNLFKNDSSRIVREIKSDPLLKAVAVITLSILGIVFLFSIISSVITPGPGMSMSMGNTHQRMTMGFSPAFGIEGLLILLIRALMFILIISLVMAGLMYLKSLYESGKLNNLISSIGTGGNNPGNNPGTNPNTDVNNTNNQ